jgi:predicted DNA-binding transcriptional regulator AlpA
MIELINAKHTAQHLCITEGTLAKWRLTGEGPKFLRVGRRIAYDPRDIQTWLDARRVSSTSQEAA